VAEAVAHAASTSPRGSTCAPAAPASRSRRAEHYHPRGHDPQQHGHRVQLTVSPGTDPRLAASNGHALPHPSWRRPWRGVRHRARPRPKPSPRRPAAWTRPTRTCRSFSKRRR
jgi:hypothetical protein